MNPVPSVKKELRQRQSRQLYELRFGDPNRNRLKSDLQITLDVYGLEKVAEVIGEIAGEELRSG